MLPVTVLFFIKHALCFRQVNSTCSFIKDLFSVYVSVYEDVQVNTGPVEDRRRWLIDDLTHLRWMLGTELGFSARVARALNK